MLILVDELQANSPETRDLVSTYQELVGERTGHRGRTVRPLGGEAPEGPSGGPLEGFSAAG